MLVRGAPRRQARGPGQGRERQDAPVAAQRSRVLASPEVGKAEITAKLCTADGLAMTKVPRRDKAAYAGARRWRWGDAVMAES